MYISFVCTYIYIYLCHNCCCISHGGSSALPFANENNAISVGRRDFFALVTSVLGGCSSRRLRLRDSFL